MEITHSADNFYLTESSTKIYRPPNYLQIIIQALARRNSQQLVIKWLMTVYWKNCLSYSWNKVQWFIHDFNADFFSEYNFKFKINLINNSNILRGEMSGYIL